MLAKSKKWTTNYVDTHTLMRKNQGKMQRHYSRGCGGKLPEEDKCVWKV